MFVPFSLSNSTPDVESCRNVEQNPKVRDAVDRYCVFLLDPEKAKIYGIKKLVRTTGFAGLTVAEVLLPGSTY